MLYISRLSLINITYRYLNNYFLFVDNVLVQLIILSNLGNPSPPKKILGTVVVVVKSLKSSTSTPTPPPPRFWPQNLKTIFPLSEECCNRAPLHHRRVHAAYTIPTP